MPVFQRENPFIRHIVLRKRVTLEDAGLCRVLELMFIQRKP